MAANFLGEVLGKCVGEEAWARVEGQELDEFEDFESFAAEGRMETAPGCCKRSGRLRSHLGPG